MLATSEILVSDTEPPPAMPVPTTSSSPPKYPHTRAFLAALAREYKPGQLSAAARLDETDVEDTSRAGNDLVAKVSMYLQEEKEDELKALLKDIYGMPDDMLEQHVLDLMHKHRDDLSGTQFLLTPTKRPLSRPSSRASSHSYRLTRPDTPGSPGTSPLAAAFRRPHTPLASPLANSNAASYIASSPTLAHAHAVANLGTSPASSPLSSPRLLNAKAVEFRPGPRPHSSASNGSFGRTDTPSPDLWAHSPLNSTTSGRGPSNLAIAAPLVGSNAYFPRATTPQSRPSAPSFDDDEDEFSPFAAGRPIPRSFHSTEKDTQWPSGNSGSASSQSNSFPNTSEDDSYPYPSHLSQLPDEVDDFDDTENQNAILTSGMTPFDVLSSVFGGTLTPAELEEALAQNGYDFENTMAWLVDRALPQQQHPQIITPTPRPHAGSGRNVLVVPRDAFNVRGRGGAPIAGRNSPRYGNRNQSGGNRVCRYFLAGECMRADCRFSHDIERALCRFWLRGTCAKGDQCEFLHRLPTDLDITPLSNALAQTDLNASEQIGFDGPPVDDFPLLNSQSDAKGRRGAHAYGNRNLDPGRTRFAAAVKKAPPSMVARLGPYASRQPVPDYPSPGQQRSNGPIAPRPSPRLRLRPPSLLPTLPTGESLNQLYMSYRSRALQLGAARNACLARAADAWRRGDGAAAKRFSRDAHDLNAKMSGEASQAANKLVLERVRIATLAVKNRDSSWSDDPGDRTARGKPCGAGLGVCLGIASASLSGEGGKLTPEERTETLLDLHGLHSQEAVEVLEEFLLGLEREHFIGLAYLVIGEEKHTGTQDPLRGTSRSRLAHAVREWLHRWNYPWSEKDGIVCVDPLTHAQ